MNNVLVIDDDAAVRKAFKFALEDSSYQLHAASSGEEGISLLNQNNFDIIFLDLKMPGMSGTETLKKIRELGFKTPVYIVTAFYKEYFQDLKQLREDGVQFELLRKPLGADEILIILDGVLNKPTVYN